VYQTTSSTFPTTTVDLTPTEVTDLATLQTDAQNLNGNTTPNVLLQNLNTLVQQAGTLRQELAQTQTLTLPELATKIQAAQTSYQNTLTSLQTAESSIPSNINQLVKQFQSTATQYMQLMRQYDNKAGAATSTLGIASNNPDFTTLPTATYTTSGTLVTGVLTTGVTSVTITNSSNSAVNESVSASALQTDVVVAGAALGNTLVITPILSNGTVDTANAVSITVQ
jgi:hypothetical protein